jgi:hypothetical protein
MGKPSDYDTGSDATVRVRANEVRKRLAAHYDAAAPKAGIRIELPPGTYVPKFNAVALAHRSLDPTPEPRPLALWQLAAPLDTGSESAIPSAIAEAAMPIERLADAFQVPVRLAAAGSRIAPGAFVIRLSISRQAPVDGTVRIGGAVFTGRTEDHWIQLSADNPEALKAAVQILTTRSGFPAM